MIFPLICKAYRGYAAVECMKQKTTPGKVEINKTNMNLKGKMYNESLLDFDFHLPSSDSATRR